MVNEKTSVNQKHIENEVLGPFFVDVLKIHPEKAQQKTNATRTFWLFGLEHEKKTAKTGNSHRILQEEMQLQNHGVHGSDL